MTRILAVAVLAFACSAQGVTCQSPQSVAIYVGPATRDGFVDVDRGVLDSITDTIREIEKAPRRYRLARVASEATLILTVTKREFGDDIAGIGIPIGGLAVIAPVKAHVIRATLRAGDYTKDFVAYDPDSDLWRHAARALVKDVTAWVDANRQRIGQ